MINEKLTEEKSLEWLIFQFPKIENPKDDIDRMQNCINLYCKNALDCIKHQQLEIEALIAGQETLQKALDETIYKLECLLCHATGSKLSKNTYTLRTMEIAVNDYVQECCREAIAEAVRH